MRLFRGRDDNFRDSVSSLARAIGQAVSLAEQDTGAALLGDWERLSLQERFAVRSELLGLYLHWMARSLFERGGNEMRVGAGQPVVDEAVVAMSGGEQSVVQTVMAVVNEAEFEYAIEARRAHARIGGSKHSGLAADIPVIAPVLAERVWERCGRRGRLNSIVDTGLMVALGLPYARVGFGERLNDVARAYLSQAGDERRRRGRG